MNNRHFALAVAGVALVAVGLLALEFPVYLNQYDQYGMQISCGRGFSANLTQAAEANGNGLVAHCGTALLIRRAWAIPTVVMGWLVLTGLLVVRVHGTSRKEGHDDASGPATPRQGPQ
ncbi:hypothetical protein [Mycobacterium botniense]|uniref:hypothetical protein n=1 Tax=Mycobacterium botniense TaxID=84962 RepID=UPI0013D2D106|nr:hypothetical protein [Mycobacterium botniense]